MRPAFSSRTKRRGAKALAPALRLFFLRASDMCHLYDDLTRLGQRLTATVPRILATILNGTIVAGMVVLLHRRRTTRLVPAAHLHISCCVAVSILVQCATAGPSLLALCQCAGQRGIERTNLQIGARPDKRRNSRAG